MSKARKGRQKSLVPSQPDAHFVIFLLVLALSFYGWALYAKKERESKVRRKPQPTNSREERKK